MLVINEDKKSLNKKEDILNIKARDIFEKSVIKANKRKSDELPEEDNVKGNFKNIDYKKNCFPSFDNIKHNIYRYINKNIPKDIDSFN